MNNLLLYLAIKYNGNWWEINKAIANHQILAKENIPQRLDVESNYLTIFDEKYCNFLKCINHPPFVLFYNGNVDLFKGDLITIVGTLGEFNVHVLQRLHEYGYSFIYEINKRNVNDAAFLISKNFRLLLYASEGINSPTVKQFTNLNQSTLIYSNVLRQEQYNINNLNMFLGRKQKILFINYDDYDDYFDIFAYSYYAKNILYKIVYTADQKIFDKWADTKAIMLQNYQLVRKHFAKLN